MKSKTKSKPQSTKRLETMNFGSCDQMSNALTQIKLDPKTFELKYVDWTKNTLEVYVTSS